MLTGDPQALSQMRLGTQMSTAELLKQLGRAPPVAVLQLCYGIDKYNLPESLLQHADDLDFTQDTLTATGESMELNPILNGVLAGFNRRRRYNRFKHGSHTLEVDRLRFQHTITEKDSDLYATEVLKKKGTDQQKDNSRRDGTNVIRFNRVCNFFQRARGCSYNGCKFIHKCAVCNRLGHGAIDCYSRRPQNRTGTRISKTDSTSEQAITQTRPPNPRTRRSRAREAGNGLRS